MAERYDILAQILIELIEKPGTGATVAALRDINIGTTTNINVTRRATQATSGYRSGLRGLALDLRMMSIGLSILKREFGGIHPVVDASISTLYIFSATVSTVMGTMRIATRVMALFTAEALAAAKVLIGVTLGLTGVAVVAGALIGLGLGKWWADQEAGIGKMRREIKSLQRDLEATTAAIRDLGVEQAGLTAQGAAYAAQIRALKREIDLQGYATDEQKARLKALESAEADVGIASGYLRAETAYLTYEQRQAEDTIEDNREAIKAYNRAILEGLGNISGLGRGFPQPALAPPYALIEQQQMGGEVRKGGQVAVETGEVIMQREQVATMMAGGGIGGPISVTISLAGARISGVRDLEGTIRRGGEAARKELDRLQLQRRRGRSRY